MTAAAAARPPPGPIPDRRATQPAGARCIAQEPFRMSTPKAAKKSRQKAARKAGAAARGPAATRDVTPSVNLSGGGGVPTRPREPTRR